MQRRLSKRRSDGVRGTIHSVRCIRPGFCDNNSSSSNDTTPHGSGGLSTGSALFAWEGILLRSVTNFFFSLNPTNPPSGFYWNGRAGVGYGVVVAAVVVVAFLTLY